MDKHRADKLDNLFREKLQQHEISPDEDYWPYLEKSLNKLSFYKFGFRHINIYNISAVVLLIPVLYFLLRSEKETVPADNKLIDTVTIKAPAPFIEHQEKRSKDISTTTETKQKKTTDKEQNKTSVVPELRTKDSVPVSIQEKENTPVIPEPVKVAEEKPKIKPKKIIYVVQQDTIVEKDTVKVRRKRKN